MSPSNIPAFSHSSSLEDHFLLREKTVFLFWAMVATIQGMLYKRKKKEGEKEVKPAALQALPGMEL